MVVENLSIINDTDNTTVNATTVNDGVRLEIQHHVFSSMEESHLSRTVFILGSGKARMLMEALKQALEDEE